jgi:lysophospholipase L1-like esterase
MQKYLSSYNQEELFDGNHPSEGGHREWANYIQKYIGDII